MSKLVSTLTFFLLLFVAAAQPSQAAVLWSADMETGNMTQWYEGGGGGEFNNGNSSSAASTTVAHGGRYSVKMTITAGGSDTGVRLFRWAEGKTNSALYYSVWYYFPQQVTASGGWWNVFQWKSRGGSCSYCSGIDPMWILHARNRSNGTMHFMLEFWPFGHQWYDQTSKDIPIGKWTHLEAYYKQSGGNSGQIIVWQDGVEIFNRNGIQTIFNTPAEWSVNNYANQLSPSTVTIYTDDAAISTTRLGPGGATGSPSPLPTPVPSVSPSIRPSPSPTIRPSPTPTPTPRPSVAPSATPIAIPTATPSPSPIPGDINGDGTVDIIDYNFIVANFGFTDCNNSADITGNCRVDIFDYNIVVTNFR